MSNASKTIARVFVSMLLAAAGVSAAHATAGSAKPLEGTWCSEDTSTGETIVQYFAAGSDITSFTVLSEEDPRRIGQQASIELVAEAPNVFVRRAFGAADEEFSVHSGRLTVNSLWIWNRGTNDETRQVLATQTYYKCDMGQALRRAQAFMASPQAEQATRMALERDADAELEGRRNASRDAYYTGVIRQFSLSRGMR
ncbi:hypothetical protein [Steroidobacter sp.]|uniref:hypothetical protein n=1 Tax=Steroidobacter sp. TaxID=1978227 RepID=UPI001A5E9574|nr:hypothetical protein [Steroidobacter sp.]MBL8268030.1 hypothetical protein [Steroidobacter sp.]